MMTPRAHGSFADHLPQFLGTDADDVQCKFCELRWPCLTEQMRRLLVDLASTGCEKSLGFLQDHGVGNS